MDYSKLTRDSLMVKALYELRLIGRDLKIKSPTSMNKSDLIDAICDAIKNKTNVEVEISKHAENSKRQGRPPKTNEIVFHDSAPEKPAPKPKKEEPAAPVVTESKLPDEIPEEEPESDILEGVISAIGGNVFTSNESAEKPKPKHVKNQEPNQQGQDRKKRPVKTEQTQPTVTAEVKSEEEVKPEEEKQDEEIKEGVLEIMPDGYGFLRAKNYEGGENDAYVAAQKIKKSGLRKGDWVKAHAKKTCENRPAGVTTLISVNGRDPEKAYRRPNFDYLTPIYPDQRYRLEIDGAQNDFAIRSIDLVAPIGKGQRAMIVSPPKAGKTTLLKNVAKSIATNYPNAHLIVLLIDERPEEVTDMQRSIKGEVVYSTFDEMPEHHTKAAELVLERAKRLVELGEDVVILMDSLTRLARAYNLTIAPTGRTLSGGIDPGALHSPKRFFGAARNIENGGSLTIIATALVDTGSRMDDVIYEEFKGTGNMEIHLDRRLTEKRIFPAIDLNRSGTRREELLLSQKELETVWNMRRMLNTGDGGDASEQMISELVKTKTNKEFMEQMDLKIKLLKQQGFWRN